MWRVRQVGAGRVWAAEGHHNHTSQWLPSWTEIWTVHTWGLSTLLQAVVCELVLRAEWLESCRFVAHLQLFISKLNDNSDLTSHWSLDSSPHKCFRLFLRKSNTKILKIEKNYTMNLISHPLHPSPPPTPWIRKRLEFFALGTNHPNLTCDVRASSQRHWFNVLKEKWRTKTGREGEREKKEELFALVLTGLNLNIV